MSGLSRTKSLRPDTTVVEVGGKRELYLRQMPACCLGSLREEVVRGSGRRETFRCDRCEKEWRIGSSLDERVIVRFEVTGDFGLGGGAA